MTVLQFQQLYFIASSTDFDLDKSIKMVGAMTGLTPDKVDKMPINKFNRLCARINRQFEILGQKYHNGTPKKLVRSGGRTYRILYDVERKPVDAGRYVEVITFGADVINNLHKIMASIVQPVRWSWSKFKWMPYERDHVDIATDMERINFEAAYHAAVFFYTLFSVSMTVIQPYLIQEAKKRGENPVELLTASAQILDGFIMPRWSQNMRVFLLNRFGA